MKNRRGILYVAVIAVLVIATLINRLYGNSAVVDLIYHSWWLILLWIALIGDSIFALIRYENITKPVLVLHAAIIFIFSGALVTFFWGEKGMLHIRAGARTVYFLDDKSSDCYTLPFEIQLDHFAVICNPITHHPTDYVSRVAIGDHQQQIRKTITVNHPLSYRDYRFLQGSYDEDLQGAMLMVNHDPWGMWLVYGGYLLFLIGGLWWLLSRKERFRMLIQSLNDSSRRILKGIFVISVLLIPLVGMVSMELKRETMPPVLLSGWLKPHVWSVTAAYALFFGLSLIAILVEVWYRKGYEEKVKTLTVMSKIILYPAIILLGIGICLGSVWANESWGAYWSWDPKEVWALITLLVYSIAVHHDTFFWLRDPIRFHRYLLFAFLSVVLTYWGVNCWLGGMHSYA